MNTRKGLILVGLAIAVLAIPWAVGPAHAGPGFGTNADGTGTVQTYYANSPAGTWTDWQGSTHASGTAMRKFVDPLPALCPAGAIPPISGGSGTPISGACIPVAVPQPSPVGTEGSSVDYYEIAIVEYSQPMHADLTKATKLRGYVQVNDPANPVKNTDGSINLAAAQAIARYLGPVIVATKGKPVRIKYTNLLPTGVAGDLPIPVDKTLMGAGLGPDNTHEYTQNRISIHLHGGYTPWISDGTPHQWTVPLGESTTYMLGASFHTVPDMADPGQGSGTLYYTNEQASRLMFYHDHAVGITRLNVYVGMAAGYLIQDVAGTGEWTLPGVGTMPEIPLVIQDKTFVPADIATQDAKWDTTHWGVNGDLWFPHVYETNQDPSSVDGTNPVGRWDWGPWFWPVFPSQFPLPTGNYGDATTTPEAFMDTPIVNGMAYPTYTVDPKAYRFRILNAANDRFFNLGLYVAEPLTIALTNGGSGYDAAAPPAVTVDNTNLVSGTPSTATATVSTGMVTAINLTNMGQGYTDTPTVTIDPPTAGVTATARAVVGNVSTTVGVITGIVVTNPGSGYSDTAPPLVHITSIAAPTTAATADAVVSAPGVVTGITVTPGTGYYSPAPAVTIDAPSAGGTQATAYATSGTEVKMVNFDASYVPPATISPDGNPFFPSTGGLMGTGWGQPDGRIGGVPDPATAGPDIIQIGSEGGLLPAPAVIPSTPINYEYNKRSVTVLNVLEHGLYLGAAERADVIVDFSQYAGKTLILYNDSPAPVPAGDPRLDYYTNGPDQSAFGGMASTKPGYGPNIRTVMQIKVSTAAAAPAYDPGPLFTALPAAYGQTQDMPIVGESVYNPAFNTTFIDTYASIFTGSAQQPNFTYSDGTSTGHVNAITLSAPAQVGSSSIYAQGAGYTTAPAVTIAPPQNAGVQATAANATLSVTAITVTSAGNGYTSAPFVTLTAPPPGGMQATATATIGTTGGTKGKVTAVTVVNPGYGYTTMPTVTFTGGGGQNAAAVATGGVTDSNTSRPLLPPVPGGILITNSGSGYTTGAVVVTIAPPTPPPKTVAGVTALAAGTASTSISHTVENKAIQELFEPVYGRMNATLGVELPFTNANTQTTIPLGYIDPPTEIIGDGETQIWKITHNGVDTHPVHFHLVNVQLINRVGWDGTVKPPPANELGWKETIKMNPLEDIIVAVRAVLPKFVYGLPESIRPLAPSEPLGSTAGFTQIDPATGNPMLVANAMQNFGWEYVWHCHILGHEENDFMRPFVFNFASIVPGAPTLLNAPAVAAGSITLTWNDPTPVAAPATLGNKANEIGFTVQRSTNQNFNQNLVAFNAPANSTSFPDTTVVAGTRYYYRVRTYNAAGTSAWLSWPRVTAQ
jgi:FtsP/CotA-like multicopper oxidase with cupredoxin domain